MGSCARISISLFLLGAAGCLRAPPETHAVDWDESCASTQPGNACLALAFSVKPSIREDAPDSLVGPLHWAVYRGGDVGLFGPGDHEALYDGVEDVLDLSQADASFLIHLADVPAEPFQVLAFLDHDGNGKSSSKDPVTFPSDAFEVRPDHLTRVDVVLDYLR